MIHDWRIRLYVALVVACSVIAVKNGLLFGVSAVPVFTVVSLGLLALALELGGVSLAHKATGSVAFIVHIAVAILFGPTWAAAVAGVSILFTDIAQRKEPIRVVFNVAQRVLGISVGTQVYLLLGGNVPFTSIEVDGLPFVLLGLLFFGINSLSVAVAIGISTRQPFKQVWSTISKGLLVYDIAASFAAVLLAWAYQRFGGAGILGVVLPVTVIRSVYLMYHRLESQSREMLELMVKAIEARDPYTSGHSVRVAAMSRAIATEMKLPYERVEQIATAALLHDVGKIHEKFAPVLRKEARLTEEEHKLLQEHPAKSAELVGVISGFRGIVLDAVRSHHERWDGNGYPDRLAGEAIPLGARIIAVADTVDAMRTDRPYRPAASYEETVRELERCRGAQFDPAIINVALGSMLVRSMFAAPQDVRGLSEMPPIHEPLKRRSSGWMRVLR
jgi:HD-GYP domain-containing protein (c-di-GMP phosphodiesterase class II)